jgi:hypothetical protein
MLSMQHIYDPRKIQTQQEGIVLLDSFLHIHQEQKEANSANDLLDRCLIVICNLTMNTRYKDPVEF